MRIGLFTDTYLPVHNGICYVVEMMRKNLEELGHEVYIFAPKPKGDFEENDSHVIRFLALKGATYEDDLTSVFFPPRELQRIHKLGLDIITFFTPNQVGLLGLMAGLRYDIPVISQYSTDIYQYVDYYPAAQKVILAFPIAAPIVLGGRLKSWGKAFGSLPRHPHLRSWMKRLAAEYITSMHDKCDAVIVLSRKHQQQLMDWHTKAPLSLIPSGIDPLPKVTPSEITKFKKKWQIAASDKVILYAGRISKEKNLDMLLDAFTKYIAPNQDNVKLVFAGDFDYRPILEKRAQNTRYSDRIIFTGSYVRQEADAIYRSATVFAFPSLTDTQGLVLNEAAQAGLPLVLCDDNVSEIFRHTENGLLAKNNPKDYATALKEILDSETLQKQMSKISIAYAGEYTEYKQIKKFEALCLKCIEEHKKVSFAGGNW